MTKPLPQFLKIGILVVVLIFIGSALAYMIPVALKSKTQGHILLRIDGFDEFSSELVLMDSNGGNIENLGYYLGSPAWSRDGRFVAAGCKFPDNSELTKICILDMSTLINNRTNWWEHDAPVKTVAVLDVPENCAGLEDEDSNQTSGLISMSWSGDGKKLAIVCRPFKETSSIVCIVPLSGDMQCWNEELGKNVFRVSWSPVEDLIAVSGAEDSINQVAKPEIYIVHPDGSDPTPFTEGWSAEWSPDGKQLAFMKLVYENRNANIGVAVIDSDGKNLRVLYPSNSSHRVNIFCLAYCESSRLTWSPDGTRLAFLGVLPPIFDGSYLLFQLDVRTGELTSLFDPSIFHSFIEEPAWGP